MVCRGNYEHSWLKFNEITMGAFKFEFGRHQISKIPREKIIAELEKVAKHFNYTDFKQDDFDKIADISYYTVNREFGSWEKALQFLADHLKSKGMGFYIASRRSQYSIQEIFDEMEKIWVQLGHRPSRNEWAALKPKMSYDTIQRHFGGWANACLKFIEYKSGGVIPADDETRVDEKNQVPPPINNNEKTKENEIQKIIERTRTVPLNLRIKVMSRDNFRCVFCGKSPATDIGVKLHVDHIIPFSKGGTNSLDNVQTLCQDCNLGKSDEVYDK